MDFVEKNTRAGAQDLNKDNVSWIFQNKYPTRSTILEKNHFSWMYFEQLCHFGDEWGRDGSIWAETESGGRSKLQEGF